MLFNEKKILVILQALAVAFVILAIIGGIKNFSMVPHWDMWNGYLGFFLEVSNGNISAWWAQHSEHRILLSRILFWIDISVFKGQGYFLIVVNYLLLSLVYLFFSIFAKEQMINSNDIFFKKSLYALILIILFSWIQKTNLIWGFQSQFILAQILPLISFFFLHKSFTSNVKSLHFFIASCFVGILSLGSMANGVITLPLLTIFAITLGMSWRRVAFLCTVVVITTVLYFYDYHPNTGHGNIKDALQNNPIGLLQYLLIYMGGPFNYFTLIGNKLLAQLAGLFLIISSIYFSWFFLKKRHSSSLQIALLFFILYEGGTALGTGGGRLIFGLEQALSSRYQTPALMAWVALLVLYAPFIRNGLKGKLFRTMAFFIIPIFLLPQQLEVFKNQKQNHFEHLIAALALELGIKDQPQLSLIFPNHDVVLSISKQAKKDNLSIFGTTLIKDINNLIGKSARYKTPTQCLGALDNISNISGVDDYVSIRGWLFQTDKQISPEQIYVLNKNRKIIGYAISGGIYPDKEKVNNKRLKKLQFKGYMLASELGQNIILQGNGPNCELKPIDTSPRVSAYSLLNAQFGVSPISINKSQILNKNEWLGSDYYKSIKSGYKVFGSYINSDADTGVISLQIKKSDSLYYRSGPSMGNQRIFINSEIVFYQELPVSSEWVTLKFDNYKLPEVFTVTFKDGGSGWGEWSAIGVKNGN